MVELYGMDHLRQKQAAKIERAAIFKAMFDEDKAKEEEEKARNVSACEGYISTSTEKAFNTIMRELGMYTKANEDVVEEEFEIYHSDEQNFGIVYNALGKVGVNCYHRQFCDKIEDARKDNKYWKSVKDRDNIFTLHTSSLDRVYRDLYNDRMFLPFSLPYLQELCEKQGKGNISLSMKIKENRYVLTVRANLVDPQENSLIEAPSEHGSYRVKVAKNPMENN